MSQSKLLDILILPLYILHYSNYCTCYNSPRSYNRTGNWQNDTQCLILCLSSKLLRPNTIHLEIFVVHIFSSNDSWCCKEHLVCCYQWWRVASTSSCEYFCSDIKEYDNYAFLSLPLVSIGVIHLYSLTGVSHEVVSTIAVALKTNHSLQTLKWVAIVISIYVLC